MPGSEVPRHVSAWGQRAGSLGFRRLVQRACLVCIPVSWSLRVLRPTDCHRGDRSFPADEILPCRDLVSACLPDLCDCEKLRPQLRSYLYSFHSQRFLVSASPLSSEPGTNPILWCSFPAPKDHRGPGPEETLDSHRHRSNAGSSDESS